MTFRKQLTFTVGATLSRALSGFVLIYILSHFLSVESFGVFTYALVVGTFLALLVDYGFDLQLSRDTAVDPTSIPSIIRSTSIIKMKLFLLLPIFLIGGWYSGLLYKSDLFIISILTIAQSIYSYQKMFLIPYRSVQNYKKEFFLAISMELILLVACIIAAYFGAGLIQIATTYLFGRFFGCLIICLVFRREFGFSHSNYKTSKILKENLPFFIHTALAAIYLSVDTLIMRKYVSDFDLGIYQAGIRALIAACLLTLVAQNVLLPRLARLKDKPSDYAHERNIYLWGSLALGIFISLIVWVVREPLILLIFGEDFLPLLGLVPYFVIIIVLRYVAAMYGALLTLQQAQGKRAIAVALTVIVVIVGDLIVIPKHGIEGAAIVLVSAHLFLNLIYAYFAHRR